MAIIGYARVSTQEQNLNLQLDALAKVGCDKVIKDHGVSTAHHRPKFESAINALETGDVFVIWKMDRAFRSLKNALGVLEDFEARGIGFRCLTEPIDTTNSIGRAMYQMRNVFAELERNLISERTIAGLEAARKRGAKLGRPRKLTPRRIEIIRRRLRIDTNITQTQIAKKLGISPQTLSRALNQPNQGKKQ